MSAPPFDRVRAPGEEEARRRALAVARAALAERPAVARSAPAVRVSAVVLAATLAAVALALGLTSPGRATAQWVGDHLSDLTSRDPKPAERPPAASRYAPLPGGGRLLAVNAQGLFAFGLGAAPRELLRDVDAAAWSPHGRFVAAVRGNRLLAVDLGGRVHWSHAEPRAIRWPIWSPSGFRVAYVTNRREIDVIAGDGTGAHLVAGSGRTRPVWQPGVAAERLATVDAASRVALRVADTGHVLWRARMDRAPRELAFTPDGRRLYVLGRQRVIVLSAATGRRLSTTPRTPGVFNLALAPRAGGGYAILRRRLAAPRQSEVVVGTKVVATDPGRIRAIAFSPHGDWLALDRPAVDGWDLLHLRGTTVDRARTLAAGHDARLSGWCCR